MQPLPANIQRLGLEPCKDCNTFDNIEYWERSKDNCERHWVRVGPRDYTHFRIKETWYVVSGTYKAQLLASIEVDEGMVITGRMRRPLPKIINNLTSLLAMLRMRGVSQELLEKNFTPERVSRMKGRVFNKLVKGK